MDTRCLMRSLQGLVFPYAPGTRVLEFPAAHLTESSGSVNLERYT